MTEDVKRRHVIAVHGTFSGRGFFETEEDADEEFFCETSPFAKHLKDGLPVARWHEFAWKGTNLESDRRKASARFSKYLKSLNLPPQDELLILAHSHGGNVALDGIRKQPIANKIALYSFGTPFIWKETRFILSAVMSIMPNIIFFLAILAMAIVIGLGHSQSLAYGVPFIEVPRNAAATAFFDNFNQFWAYPFAILIVVVSWLWLIGRPLKRSRYRAKFNYLDVEQFQLTRIWRTDDEAIALLSNEPNIAVPISIFNSFFRFLAAGIFISFVGYGFWVGYNQLESARQNIDSSLSWNFVLPMGGEKIGLGLSVLALLLLLYPIFRFGFKKPLTWLMSSPVNSLLRKTSMGEDGYIRIDANNRPDIPRQFDNDFNEQVEAIAPILEEVKRLSDDYLLENRTAIMRALSAGDGYMQDILNDGELTRSLIHCNYFTNDMARFIAEREANWEPPKDVLDDDDIKEAALQKSTTTPSSKETV